MDSSQPPDLLPAEEILELDDGAIGHMALSSNNPFRTSLVRPTKSIDSSISPANSQISSLIPDIVLPSKNNEGGDVFWLNDSKVSTNGFPSCFVEQGTFRVFEPSPFPDDRCSFRTHQWPEQAAVGPFMESRTMDQDFSEKTAGNENTDWSLVKQGLVDGNELFQLKDSKTLQQTEYHGYHHKGFKQMVQSHCSVAVPQPETLQTPPTQTPARRLPFSALAQHRAGARSFPDEQGAGGLLVSARCMVYVLEHRMVSVCDDQCLLEVRGFVDGCQFQGQTPASAECPTSPGTLQDLENAHFNFSGTAASLVSSTLVESTDGNSPPTLVETLVESGGYNSECKAVCSTCCSTSYSTRNSAVCSAECHTNYDTSTLNFAPLPSALFSDFDIRIDTGIVQTIADRETVAIKNRIILCGLTLTVPVFLYLRFVFWV